MRPCVFIHTNHKQKLGALVSAHSMRRNSKSADKFDVKLIELEDHREFFDRYEGREYRRDGDTRTWLNDDLQSFTPLRFMTPKLMEYEGKAVVVDPDVFAQGDIYELLTRNMDGKAICCRSRGKEKPEYNSSAMLLDCANLTHWKLEDDFDALFQKKREYKIWMNLGYEQDAIIGSLEPEWNDFDNLTPKTKLLHNTRRRTQPWKSGLPADFVPAERSKIPGFGQLLRLRRKVFGEYAFLGAYKSHPDNNQERFFFSLLKECLENGTVSEAMVRDEMEKNHVRHDAFAIMEKLPTQAKAA